MRFLTARRLAFAALVPALFVFSAVPGCSNESEGERCGDDPQDPSKVGTPNDDDCSAPLICVAADTLIANQANRCCNSNPGIVNDSRCLRSTGTAASGGTGGTADASAGGTAGSGGTGGSAGSDVGQGGAATAGAAPDGGSN